MRRFVTYIYEYEGGIRGRNVGFVRTDLREDGCRMELQIRGFDRFNGKCPVYLTVNDPQPLAIPVAELLLSQGMGSCRIFCAGNRIGKSNASVRQTQTLNVDCGNNRQLVGILCSCTPAPEFFNGNFAVFDDKSSEPHDISVKPEPSARTFPSQSNAASVSTSRAEAASDYIAPRLNTTSESSSLQQNAASGSIASRQNTTSGYIAPLQNIASGFSSPQQNAASGYNLPQQNAASESIVSRQNAASESIMSRQNAASESIMPRPNATSSYITSQHDGTSTQPSDANSTSAALQSESTSIQNPVLRTDSVSVRSFTPQSDSAPTDTMFSQVPIKSGSTHTDTMFSRVPTEASSVPTNAMFSRVPTEASSVPTDTISSQDPTEFGSAPTDAMSPQTPTGFVPVPNSVTQRSPAPATDFEPAHTTVPAPTPESTTAATVPPTEAEFTSAPDSVSAHDSTPVQVSTPQAQELAQPVVSYKKIEITDIRRLPKSNWNLCSNRFLIHGFFNYRYLILKTVEQDKEKKQYLGVPGIYEQPERMMALLFGFPEFEAAERQTMTAARQATSSVEQTMTPAGQTTSSPKNMIGIFGYWMCPLN